MNPPNIITRSPVAGATVITSDAIRTDTAAPGELGTTNSMYSVTPMMASAPQQNVRLPSLAQTFEPPPSHLYAVPLAPIHWVDGVAPQRWVPTYVTGPPGNGSSPAPPSHVSGATDPIRTMHPSQSFYSTALPPLSQLSASAISSMTSFASQSNPEDPLLRSERVKEIAGSLIRFMDERLEGEQDQMQMRVFSLGERVFEELVLHCRARSLELRLRSEQARRARDPPPSRH
ncbi:hypothetical protein M427DRAFT_57036 [Gonapodya prolifera JEL478]|uniref:Uncharacterized protein n=1 Tax=Gonapodya prolifera (strain JEL478) TaxID=1344416 RepID=A0A139AFH5_GONPJ|nr:hypothetical protein M427DRAFT_57036 [Gonapodya prolifera JEL478]|eukprot:KXS15163.1 hypothetical protein M427DRAFT_57036 [Gonapodya prolifera JEL478]